MVTTAFVTAAAGFGASAGLVAGTRRWARRAQLIDRPNDRSLHATPTPRGGGVGIVLPVCITTAAAGWAAPAGSAVSLWIAGLSLTMAAVGFIDDVRSLPPSARLVIHLAAASLATLVIGSWSAVSWPGVVTFTVGPAAAPLTLLLLAYLTNLYNFMDGSDGIAGAQALMAGVGWAMVGSISGDSLLTTTGVVLAASSAGFLLFNWQPASIFMGDVGSLFLGFLLAALAVYAARQSPALGTAGLLFVWPFIFDSVFTILRRITRRENLFRAHRSHLYQRLILTGVSHRAIALTYGALAAVGVAAGLAVASGHAAGSRAGALAIGLLAVGLWAAVVRRERAPLS